MARRASGSLQDTWDAVDTYFNGAVSPSEAVLDAALAASRAAGLPDIAVAPNQGALLNVLARSTGAKRILEVGTLGGYSTIWLARALPPGGRLVTLELEKRHADVARANFARAGLADVIELRQGRAIDLLPKLAAEKFGPVDFSFIDADKPSNADYFDWAVRLSRPGSLIVVDNVVRGGGVTDAHSPDASVQGVRRLVDHLRGDRRVTTTVIQTVGSKGYDGFALSVVL